MKVLIGVDPHKGSHTAVAIDHDEVPLGQLRVRATRMQCEQLLEWAEIFPERRWAIESAGGLGYLLAQQLIAAGETSSTSRPRCRPEYGCSARASLRRTTPTTPCPPRWPPSVTGVCTRSWPTTTPSSCACWPTVITT